MSSISRRSFLAAGAAAAAVGALGIAGCSGGGSSESKGEDATLGVAYQYGLSYAPVVIAMEQGLIEAAYNEATGGTLTIEWNQMSSGADINTGITSGSIQAGFMGLGPSITGISTGLDYKIFTNLSNQGHGLMTNDPDIKSLADIVGTDKQIALVNTGSFQHIILGMALANAGLDPHALDSNIVAMAHPDGMAALQSGNVACHLTTSPYIFTERKDSTLHELTEVAEAWSKEDSFNVGVAASSLYENTDVYNALKDGLQAAMDLINSSPADAAALLCDLDGNTAEEEQEYLEQATYQPETTRLYDFALFMGDNGFIENPITAYEDLVYDGVQGS